MKLRPRQTKDHRCAICHDVSGGLVICQGCGTYVHAQCLLYNASCPTPGCDECDPLVAPPPSVRGWLQKFGNYIEREIDREAENKSRSRPKCTLAPAPERLCSYREDGFCTMELRSEDDRCMFYQSPSYIIPTASGLSIAKELEAVDRAKECCYTDPDSPLFMEWCSCGRHKGVRKLGKKRQKKRDFFHAREEVVWLLMLMLLPLIGMFIYAVMVYCKAGDA